MIKKIKSLRHRVGKGNLDINAERAKADALFASIGVGAIATNEEGVVERINDLAAGMLGFSRDEIVGKWFSGIVISEDENGNVISNIERPMSKALLEGKPVNTKLYYKRKDGSKLPVFLTVSPIILNGLPIGAIEVFRDITVDNEVDKAKDEFVSLASHQLRTPLTASRLFLEMLLDGQVGELGKAQKEYIEKVEVSTLRMIRMVNDFLNASRADLGRLKVSPEAIQLEDLVSSHVDELRQVALKKKVDLSFESKKLPPVLIDQSLYGQVVHNLLTNAVRYTPAKGHVKVKLDINTNGYELIVSDNAIGIPADSKVKLFERFFRADNAKEVEGEGSGLGLYLVKKILDASGGKISYESTQNVGTTFHVIIPKTGMKAKVGEVGINESDKL